MASEEMLPLRPLGDTEIDVSVLGLGTVKFGRNQQVKYPSPFDLPTDDEILSLLSIAKDLGINFLDTAPAYGSSEERIGQLLTNREQWVLGSKVGEGFVNGESVFAFDGAAVRASIENSLKLLKTDYLDVVLIHSDGNDIDILNNTDCVETLQTLKQQGYIRSIGISGKTVEGGLAALEQMDVAMVTYNTEATAEAKVIEYAAAHNKGILIKKAMNSGHLSVADNGAEQALDFVLSKSGVSSAIVGTINPDHLRANVAAAVAVCK